jgi:glycine/serine hydroxymethyltransferase
MGPGEMERIAGLIDRALTRPDEATLARVREEVEELSSTFPLYQAKSTAGRVRRSA